jgi:hypothetical protein
MNAKEMHIAFELGLQKLASNQYDNFDADEKDIALNIAQDRFVNQMMTDEVRQGKRAFETEQKRLDSLRNIIRKNCTLPAYIPDENSHLYEEDMVYGVLPRDYWYLQSDRSKVKYLENSDCSFVVDGNKASDKEYIAIVPYKALESDVCNPNFDFKLSFLNKLDGTSRIDDLVFELNDSISSLKEEVDKFQIINLVLDTLNRNNNQYENNNYFSSNPEVDNLKVDFEVYWERYRDQYYQDHFIFVTKSFDLAFDIDTVAVTDAKADTLGGTILKSNVDDNIILTGFGFENGMKVQFNDVVGLITITTNNGSFTALADQGNNITRVSATAHGLSVGDTVKIDAGSNGEFDAKYIVTNVDTVNDFDIFTPFDFTSTDTGTWVKIENSVTVDFPEGESALQTLDSPISLTIKLLDSAGTTTLSTISGFYIVTEASFANVTSRMLNIDNDANFKGIYVAIDVNKSTTTTSKYRYQFFSGADEGAGDPNTTGNNKGIADFNSELGSKLGRFYEVCNLKEQLDVTYSVTSIKTGTPRNRLVSTDELYQAKSHPFTKPNKNSPLSTIAGNYIFGYDNGEFIIEEFKIDYVRRPRRISLKHNQSCELHEGVHQQIVDLAVQYALSSTFNPRLPSHIEERVINN